MENSWTQEIISQWKAERIELNIGASNESISELEKKLEFKFPADFHEMYLQINGFANYDWRSNMFSIWPLGRILEEYQSNQNPVFIGFCDYLINILSLGFSRSRPGIFKSYASAEPVDVQELVASTFQEALQLINSDSEKIY